MGDRRCVGSTFFFFSHSKWTEREQAINANTWHCPYLEFNTDRKNSLIEFHDGWTSSRVKKEKLKRIWMCLSCWCEERIRSIIHWRQTWTLVMKKKKRRRRRKRDVDTDAHTPIEKELYICALTNLPRITHTHTMAASQAYSIFHLSLILLRIFCRECHDEWAVVSLRS